METAQAFSVEVYAYLRRNDRSFEGGSKARTAGELADQQIRSDLSQQLDHLQSGNTRDSTLDALTGSCMIEDVD